MCPATALLHLCTSAPLHHCTTAPLRHCTSAYLHLFISAPLHLCTSAPLRRCTATLIWQCCYAGMDLMVLIFPSRRTSSFLGTLKTHATSSRSSHVPTGWAPVATLMVVAALSRPSCSGQMQSSPPVRKPKKRLQNLQLAAAAISNECTFAHIADTVITVISRIAVATFTACQCHLSQETLGYLRLGLLHG